jgi:hypothetical protein
MLTPGCGGDVSHHPQALLVRFDQAASSNTARGSGTVFPSSSDDGGRYSGGDGGVGDIDREVAPSRQRLRRAPQRRRGRQPQPQHTQRHRSGSSLGSTLGLGYLSGSLTHVRTPSPERGATRENWRARLESSHSSFQGTFGDPDDDDDDDDDDDGMDIESSDGSPAHRQQRRQAAAAAAGSSVVNTPAPRVELLATARKSPSPDDQLPRRGKVMTAVEEIDIDTGYPSRRWGQARDIATPSTAGSVYRGGMATPGILRDCDRSLHSRDSPWHFGNKSVQWSSSRGLDNVRVIPHVSVHSESDSSDSDVGNGAGTDSDDAFALSDSQYSLPTKEWMSKSQRLDSTAHRSDDGDDGDDDLLLVYPDPVALQVAAMSVAERQRRLLPACELNDAPMCRQLLAAGASPLARDLLTQQTPLQAARMSGAHDCLQIIQDAIQDLPDSVSRRTVERKLGASVKY